MYRETAMHEVGKKEPKKKIVVEVSILKKTKIGATISFSEGLEDTDVSH